MCALFNRFTNFIKYVPTQLFNKTFTAPCTVSSFNLHSLISKPITVNTVNKEGKKSITENVLKEVNESNKNSPSRLFAVVQICGKQFKITTGDVIVVEGYWPPDAGDKMSLDKVLCAGGADFSLIGTPLVQSGFQEPTHLFADKQHRDRPTKRYSRPTLMLKVCCKFIVD